MTKKCLESLIETVTILKTDMAWVKKGVYVTAISSLSAVLGIVVQLLLKR